MPDHTEEETGDAFPEKVTAFRPGMAVHGKYGKPCPVCGAPVQRIVYAQNECNYCASAHAFIAKGLDKVGHSRSTDLAQSLDRL